MAFFEPFPELRARLKHLAGSTHGVAAVEFALVLPVMMLMFLGMTELTWGISTDRKVTLASRTIADLTGRSTTIDNNTMNNIFAATNAVIAPYDSSQARMVISSIAVLPTGAVSGGIPVVKGVVCWSEARNGGTPLGKGSVVTVPSGFDSANTSYIFSDVQMPFAPMFGKAFTGTLNLQETTPWPVRNAREVVRSGIAACLP